MHKSCFLLSSFLLPLCSHTQEKKPADMMHNPRLYFNYLPQRAKTLVNENLFHYFFERINHNPGIYELILRNIKNFSQIDFSFINSLPKAKHVYSRLWWASNLEIRSVIDILKDLQKLLPIAGQDELGTMAIHYLLITCYAYKGELQKIHFQQAQEFIDQRESQRIGRLYLSKSELATWKLRQLMKPPFNEEHRAPYEIHVSRKKDARIASQVGYLLSEGAYANAYCYDNCYFLTCAATWRMPLVVELLLKAGADPNEGAALWWAKGARVTKLLLAAGANPNIKYNNGKTALFPDPSWASYSSVAKTRLLLQAGADPNIDRSKHGFPGSPLTACLCRLKKTENRIPLIETLLDGGADRTVPVRYYNTKVTAEDLARSHGMKQVVELLAKPRKIA